MDAKLWLRVGSDPSWHLLWFLAATRTLAEDRPIDAQLYWELGNLDQANALSSSLNSSGCWQSALSCWGVMAVRERRCHQGVCLVCNGV